jgi:hypothetical protein
MKVLILRALLPTGSEGHDRSTEEVTLGWLSTRVSGILNKYP